MTTKQSIGKLGEDISSEYLRKNEYNILDRNFSCRQGELDIIAFDTKSNEVVFVEVKTRTNFNFGFPSEAVNRMKKTHLINSMKYYLYIKGIENAFVRIDVIEIVIDTSNNRYKLNHLKNVF